MAAEAEAAREARAKVRPCNKCMCHKPVHTHLIFIMREHLHYFLVFTFRPVIVGYPYFSLLTYVQVIAAEGEMNASRALKEASLVIAESPSALQLRYLQTLNTIAAEKNSTIIFPLPMDIISHFIRK